MARKSHNKRHKGRGRKRHGGGSPPPLQSGSYPGSETGGGNWVSSVTNGTTAAISNAFKGPLGMLTGTPQANAIAYNKIALQGVGNSGSGGYSNSGGQRGGSRRRRGGTRRRRGGAMAMPPGGVMGKVVPPHSAGGSVVKAPGPPVAVGAASRALKGGMFATFGALLKEALVPLGLLAAQQTYGKRYSKKHRSSSSHTRKHRR